MQKKAGRTKKKKRTLPVLESYDDDDKSDTSDDIIEQDDDKDGEYIVAKKPKVRCFMLMPAGCIALHLLHCSAFAALLCRTCIALQELHCLALFACHVADHALHACQAGRTWHALLRNAMACTAACAIG